MNGIGTNRVVLVTVYSSFVIALHLQSAFYRSAAPYFLPYSRKSVHMAWMYHIRHCPGVMCVR